MPFSPERVKSKSQMRKFFALGIGEEMTKGMTSQDYHGLPDRVKRGPLQEAARRRLKKGDK